MDLCHENVEITGYFWPFGPKHLQAKYHDLMVFRILPSKSSQHPRNLLQALYE